MKRKTQSIIFNCNDVHVTKTKPELMP